MKPRTTIQNSLPGLKSDTLDVVGNEDSPAVVVSVPKTGSLALATFVEAENQKYLPRGRNIFKNLPLAHWGSSTIICFLKMCK